MDKRQGRRISENCDEKTISPTQMINTLLEKFENTEHVLDNAALTAALMNYIFNKSHDYFSLLYYYTIQKYLRINMVKNDMRNYNHINMEIYTIFIHPKSILRIPIKNEELIKQIEDNINNHDCIIYFFKISQSVVTDIISKYVDQFRESIRSGLETNSYCFDILEDITRTRELSILEGLHKSINSYLTRTQKSRCLAQKQETKNFQMFYDFQVNAIITAMNTQYEHFIHSKKYSYTIKHPANINPLKTFLSCQPSKSMNKIRTKGHSFEENSLSTVAFCLVCDIIFWGSHPHCLYCRNCKKAVHRECKDAVTFCFIDPKRNRKIDPFDIDSESDKATEGESFSGKMNLGLTKINDDKAPPAKKNSETLPSEEILNDIVPMEKLKEKPSVAVKPSKLKLQQLKLHSSSSFASDKPSKYSIKYAKSLNSMTNSKIVDVDTVSRSKSVLTQPPKNPNGQELNRFQMRSTSEDSGLAASMEPLSLPQFDEDDEMKVLETFEPEVELQLFKTNQDKLDPKNRGDYPRLLVLMEFHHKTKFTRMTLKRFKYYLVDPWLRKGEHLDLFHSLSLDCIDRLYKLIGSLVNEIDLCKSDDSYDTSIAERVLNWLSDDDEKNLQSWLELCTDLCCTNVLHSVKANWLEQKQLFPRLNDLCSVEINRMLVIDQLSNMRPFLFNLPMIVRKIVKDLNMFPQFRDEAKVWEQVGSKLSLLPELIDKRCMSVVDLINNGTIISSSLKYKSHKKQKEYSKEMEMYINNFPRTVFKNKFKDFQFVKISNLRESGRMEIKGMQSSVYIKEEVDAAVICYEQEMILLQKENDKFLLKQFKSVGADKLFPVISFRNVHATKQKMKDEKQFQYELSVLLINQAILIQILFKEETPRDMWYDHIRSRSDRVYNENNVKYQKSATSNPTNIDSVDFADTRTDSNCSKMTLLQNSFNDSANHFLTTFDLISNELSTDNAFEGVKSIKDSGSNTPIEFMLDFMNLLKDYVIVGAQMLEESQFVDSDTLLQKDVIAINLPKLSDITKQMDALITAQVENETSDESTLEDEDMGDKLSSTNIHIISLCSQGADVDKKQKVQEYIEGIINGALFKIQCNSKE